MSKNNHHAHHFSSYDLEASAGKLGVWLFLCTEILMFGGLFVGYLIFRNLYLDTFQSGSQFLDWKLGSLNTVVLLFSSFTMAISIYFAQKNKMKKCAWALGVTFLCGAFFMVIKYIEYSHKIHLGILPGSFFAYQEEGFVKGLPLYFSFYYLMTGLHGSHVLVGMGLIGWVFYRAIKGTVGPSHYIPIEFVGLFWHLVDLIWIYLFPLLYLVD